MEQSKAQLVRVMQDLFPFLTHTEIEEKLQDPLINLLTFRVMQLGERVEQLEHSLLEVARISINSIISPKDD